VFIILGKNTPPSKEMKEPLLLLLMMFVGVVALVALCELTSRIEYKEIHPFCIFLLIMLLDPPKTTRKSPLDNKHATPTRGYTTKVANSLFILFND
jgi:hypothetical protein